MVFYECELCIFSSIYKNDFNRHLNTKKHLNNEKDYEEDKLKNPKKGLKKDSKRNQKGLKIRIFWKKKISNVNFVKLN